MTQRNMLFYVCPLAAKPVLWRRCCRRLLDHIQQFDGVRTLCIATGEGMEPEEAVRKEFGDERLDNVIVRPNDPVLYESAHWHTMLETVVGAPGITWYGHTKGVSYSATTWPIQAWVEACFEITLTSPIEVERTLCDEHYLTTGPFLLRNPGKEWGPWCYSGTFFWFHQRALERAWRTPIEHRWAVESWSSRVSAIGEGKCMCCQDAALLWKEEGWTGRRLQEVAEWRDRRPGQTRKDEPTSGISKPTLNVVTPCSRPENLATIAYYLKHRLPSFEVRWYVVVDSSAAAVPTSVEGAYFLGEVAKKGYGGVQRNLALSEITEGLVWFLDDDNLPHPDFDAFLSCGVSESPKASYLFGQLSAWGVPVREAGPKNIRLGGIDMAQFVFWRDTIGGIRFPESGIYESDWEFFRSVWEKHAGDVQYMPYATYYNALAPVLK